MAKRQIGHLQCYALSSSWEFCELHRSSPAKSKQRKTDLDKHPINVWFFDPLPKVSAVLTTTCAIKFNRLAPEDAFVPILVIFFWQKSERFVATKSDPGIQFGNPPM